MMGDYYAYGAGNMFSFGWIFMLIFWGLVIWAIITFIKSTNSHAEKRDDNKSLDILKERYARSELSKEEYQEKREDLLK